ncbi:Carboxylesterase 5A [Sarracenia purpurea var. burkii]
MKEQLSMLMEETLPGTYHAADFSYWTPVSNPWDIPNRNFTNETIQMIHTFTKTVAQFAKTGDPNNEDLKIHWAPSTVDKPCYMKIDKEMQLINGKLNGERHEFWENLKHQLRPEC